MEALVCTYREGIEDQLYAGNLVVVNKRGKIIHSIGDPYKLAYMDSLANFFQVVPSYITNSVKKYDLYRDEVCLLLGSHSGEKSHRDTVMSLLGKIKKSENDILCGQNFPLYKPLRTKMKSENYVPTPVYSSDIGKHIAILMSCMTTGIDIDGYNELSHPSQQAIFDIICDVCQVEKENIVNISEYQGLPSFAIPIYNTAVGYSKLANFGTNKYVNSFRRMIDAIKWSPFMYGGTQRLCTDLYKVTASRILGKHGNDSYYAISILDKGIGIVLKLDAPNVKIRDFIIVETLKQIGALTDEEMHELSKYTKLDVYNKDNKITSQTKVMFQL